MAATPFVFPHIIAWASPRLDQEFQTSTPTCISFKVSQGGLPATCHKWPHRRFAGRSNQLEPLLDPLRSSS